MTRKNLRRWAEAKQRRAEQQAPPRGWWSYGPHGDGTPIFIEDAPFGTYVAPTAWLPTEEQPLFPDAIGELLHAILDPKPTPGTYTISAPPGWECDDEGEPVRPLFWPSLTIETHPPAASAPTGQVRPDGAGLHPLLRDHDIDRLTNREGGK